MGMCVRDRGPWPGVLAKPPKNEFSPLPSSEHFCPIFGLFWLSSVDDQNKTGACLDPLFALILCEMLIIVLEFYILMRMRLEPAVLKTNSFKPCCEVMTSCRKLVGFLPLERMAVGSCRQAALYKPRSGWFWESSWDVLWEPHLFVNLQEAWGWVFHSSTTEKKKRKGTTSCQWSPVFLALLTSLSLKKCFSRTIPQGPFSVFGTGIWNCCLQGKTHKATNYFVDSIWLCPFITPLWISHTSVALAAENRSFCSLISILQEVKYGLWSVISMEHFKLLEKETWLKMIVFLWWSNFPNSFSNWFAQTNHFWVPTTCQILP